MVLKWDQDLKTLGPGTRDLPQNLKMGPRTTLKFKHGTLRPPSKFKSGTQRPPTKFKSGSFIITFLHCYIYNMEIFSTNSRYSKLHSLF